VVPLRIRSTDSISRPEPRRRLVQHGHRAVCQAVVREVHGTLPRRLVAVIETGDEVVEYLHDRRLNFGIYRFSNRLSAAHRDQSQPDQRDGSEDPEHLSTFHKRPAVSRSNID
jgi:hypothetical protein